MFWYRMCEAKYGDATDLCTVYQMMTNFILGHLQSLSWDIENKKKVIVLCLMIYIPTSIPIHAVYGKRRLVSNGAL
jgi:hypothetical protein